MREDRAWWFMPVMIVSQKWRSGRSRIEENVKVWVVCGGVRVYGRKGY
jgi:hypothetical protein